MPRLDALLSLRGETGLACAVHGRTLRPLPGAWYRPTADALILRLSDGRVGQIIDCSSYQSDERDVYTKASGDVSAQTYDRKAVPYEPTRPRRGFFVGTPDPPRPAAVHWLHMPDRLTCDRRKLVSA